MLFSHMQAEVYERGDSPTEAELDGITQETIIITPLKQRERRGGFCGVSVGLTAPEERLRDHVCGAVIRQERFQKGSAVIAGSHADST